MISVKYSRGADPCEGKQLINVYYGSTKDNVCDSPASISVYVNNTSSILQDVADDGQGIWLARDCSVCAPTGWYMDNPSSNGIAYYFDRDQCYIVDSSLCNRESIQVMTNSDPSRLCYAVGTVHDVYIDSENFNDATGMWADGISNTPANVPSGQWYSGRHYYSGELPTHVRYWTTDSDGGEFTNTYLCGASTTIQMQLNLYNSIASSSNYLNVYVNGTLYQVSNSLKGESDAFIVDVQPNSVLQITAQAQDNTLNNDVIITWYDEVSQAGESDPPISDYAEDIFDYNVPNLPAGSLFNIYVEAFSSFNNPDGPSGGTGGPSDPDDGPSDPSGPTITESP